MLPCRLEPWVLMHCAGYYVNSSSVPKVLRWLPRASLIQHAFEALCVNEFKDLEFEASGPAPNGDALTGEQVGLVFPLNSSLSQCLMALKQIRVAEAWSAVYCLNSADFHLQCVMASISSFKEGQNEVEAADETEA